MLNLNRTVLPISYFLLADSADLLFCNNAFNLLVENPLLLHLKSNDRNTDIKSSFLQHSHSIIKVQNLHRERSVVHHFSTKIQIYSVTDGGVWTLLL